jgi:methionyl-tRNA formyltransferase
MNKDFNIVFMGSPDFALPTLKALAENYRISGVVTQPDKPAGRGRQVTAPPVKVFAQWLGIPIIQPYRLKDVEAMQQLTLWAPDAIVVAAFGQILRQAVLDLPKFGCINVHASLLPRWRGAAPIPAAILNGDEKTGISIMKMDAGLDTGDVLRQSAIAISPQDTGGSLSERLAQLGSGLLISTLSDYFDGKITPQPQDNVLATLAPKVEKTDGVLDFHQPAAILERKVRAFNPWPGAYTIWNKQILKIHLAHHVQKPASQCGEFVVHDGLPAIGTQDGVLVLDIVQPAGKNRMAGDVFLRGAKTWGKQ